MCLPFRRLGSNLFRKNFDPDSRHSFLSLRAMGSLCTDFYCNVLFTRISHNDDNDLFFTCFEEPLGLNKGKKVWNRFNAACEFSGTLRQQGQLGITISVYLADGALFRSLERRFQAMHLLYYRSGLASEDELIAFRLEISGWTICLKCSSHSCSNALKWGF